MAQDALDMTTEQAPGARIARLGGRIDHTNSDAFRDALDGLVKEAAANGEAVILDLERLELITSAGFRALWMAHSALKDSGGRLMISGVRGPVEEIFRISRFMTLLDIHPDLKSAASEVSDETARSVR